MTTTPPPITTALEELIRVELARRNLTNRDLADATGLSLDTVGRRRRGVSSWTLDEIAAIGVLFGMEVRIPLVGPEK